MSEEKFPHLVLTAGAFAQAVGLLGLDKDTSSNTNVAVGLLRSGVSFFGKLAHLPKQCPSQDAEFLHSPDSHMLVLACERVGSGVIVACPVVIGDDINDGLNEPDSNDAQDGGESAVGSPEFAWLVSGSSLQMAAKTLTSKQITYFRPNDTQDTLCVAQESRFARQAVTVQRVDGDGASVFGNFAQLHGMISASKTWKPFRLQGALFAPHKETEPNVTVMYASFFDGVAAPDSHKGDTVTFATPVRNEQLAVTDTMFTEARSSNAAAAKRARLGDEEEGGDDVDDRLQAAAAQAEAAESEKRYFPPDDLTAALLDKGVGRTATASRGSKIVLGRCDARVGLSATDLPVVSSLALKEAATFSLVENPSTKDFVFVCFANTKQVCSWHYWLGTRMPDAA